MKQNKEFTIENLLDPSFIDAKSESFLQKAVNAYRKDKEQYSKSVLRDIFDMDNSAYRYIK